MKRIAVFCDGTWNTPDKTEEGKLCQTNVVKLANALSSASKDGKVQMLYYDTGIGSEGSMNQRVFDGATGTGISKKILQAYSGILKKENLNLLAKAYSIYHSRHPRYNPREIEATLFRKTYAVEETTVIKFIGVWDTVGALGNPLFLKGITSKRNQFHDTDLSSRIRYAFHAISVDEKRKNFEAALWHQQPGTNSQVLEQMWFPGVHTDIGGGNAENESGLSDIPLQWMLEKAESCDLNFDNISINPDPMAGMHESYRGFYTLIKKFYRPIGLEIPGRGTTNEFIHPSVLERYKNNPSYKPENLVEYFKKHPELYPGD